eukprot:m.51636 g.51636  ORF g.51636 m.51636 type:complete len:486 (+) comp10955_c0_seq1:67-1524(+)
MPFKFWKKRGGDAEEKNAEKVNEFTYNEKLVSEDDVKQCKEWTRKLRERAEREEPRVTAVLQKVAEETNSELYGLNHKFKGEASMNRKLVSCLEWRRQQLVSFGTKGHAAKKENNSNITKMGENGDNTEKEEKNSTESQPSSSETVGVESVALGDIADSLRYTFVCDEDGYVQMVNAVIEALKEANMEIHKSKNYWKQGDHYQGINMHIKDSTSGLLFEVQYHTTPGIDVKKQCHALYEKYRVEKSYEKKKKYFDAGAKVAGKLKIPENVLDIPHVTAIPPPDPITIALEAVVADAHANVSSITSHLEKVVAPYITKDTTPDFSSLLELEDDVVDWMEENSVSSVGKAIDNAIHDTISFIVVFDTDEYVNKIKKLINDLPSKKHKLLSTINYWSEGDAYNGIHIRMEYKVKKHVVRYELRIHTPESFVILVTDSNDYIARYSTLSPSQAHDEYEALVKKWDTIARPDGVMGIGKLEEFDIVDDVE